MKRKKSSPDVLWQEVPIDPVQLFNPYHDEHGRFTTSKGNRTGKGQSLLRSAMPEGGERDSWDEAFDRMLRAQGRARTMAKEGFKAATIVSFAGIATALASSLTGGIVDSIRLHKQKSETDTMFSVEIKGRRYSATYGGVVRGARNIAKVAGLASIAASIVRIGISIASVVTGDFRMEIAEEEILLSDDYPDGTSQKDFASALDEIKSLFERKGKVETLSEEEVAQLVLLTGALVEFLNDAAARFVVLDGVSRPFVTIDEGAVLDKRTAQFIVDSVVSAGQKVSTEGK